MVKPRPGWLLLSLILVLFSCRGETVYYYAHIEGYVKESAVGVNGVIIDIYDYNEDNYMSGRLRGSDTTATRDGQSGFYQMDRVCYGSNRGVLQIGVAIDSLKNPAYKTMRTYQAVKDSFQVLPDINLVRK